METTDHPGGSFFRRPIFWALLTVVSVVSVVFALRFFAVAFPVVGLDLAMDRDAALSGAAELAQEWEWGPEDFRQAASFGEDDREARTYLELELGVDDAFTHLVQEADYHPYVWRVRHFREDERTEVTVRLTPAGEAYGFTLGLPEDEPGAALVADSARALAESLAPRWNVDLEPYRLVESSQETRPGGRVDHTFVYQRDDADLGDADARLRLRVAGDRLSEVRYLIRVPEAFSRRYQEIRSGNETVALAAGFVLILIFGLAGCGGGVFYLVRKRALIWKPALAWGLVVAGLSALAILNGLPLAWMGYDTAVSRNLFLAEQLLGAVGVFFLGGGVLAVIFMAAEGLTRRALPNEPLQWKLWSPGVANTRSVVGRTVGGYLLAGVHLGFVVAFYLVAGRREGWWMPSEALIQPDLIATYVPAVTGIAISLMAGFWEESLFRAVPVAIAVLLGARFGWKGVLVGMALVFQALVFAAGHADYPQQPPYARVTELVVPATIWGLVYLRFGLLPVILAHALYNLTWFSLPIFAAPAGLWLDRFVVVGVALVPLAVVLVRVRQGGLLDRVPEEGLNRSLQQVGADEPEAPFASGAPVEAGVPTASGAPVETGGPSAGQPSPGQPSPGQPSPGQPSPGHPSPGHPLADEAPPAGTAPSGAASDASASGRRSDEGPRARAEPPTPGATGPDADPAPAMHPAGARRVRQALVGAGAVGLLLWIVFMPPPPPGPPLDLTRSEAVEIAREHLSAEGRMPDDQWRPVARAHSGSGQPHRFIWERGGPEARWLLLEEGYLAGTSWLVRFVRFEGPVEERAEEFRVTVASGGEVRRFQHVLPEERAGAELVEDEARELASAELDRRFGQDPVGLDEVSAQANQRPDRLDWAFTWSDTRIHPLDVGDSRIRVGVAGDLPVDGYRFVHVAEDWERENRQRATRDLFLGLPAMLLLAGVLLGTAALGVVRWARGRGGFHAPSFWALAGLVLAVGVLEAWNGWPSAVAGFGTAQPFGVQVFMSLMVTLMGGLLLGVMVGLSVGFLHGWAGSFRVGAEQPGPSEAGAAQPGAAPWGLLAGLGAAGFMRFYRHVLPPDGPEFWSVAAAGAHIPALSRPLDAVVGLVMNVIVVLFFAVLLDQVTRGWTRARGKGALVALAGGLALTITIPSEGPAALVAGVLLGAGFLSVLAVLVRAHGLAMVPALVAAFLAMGALGAGFQGGHPGALAGGVLAAVVFLAMGVQWSRVLERIAPPPSGPREAVPQQATSP